MVWGGNYGGATCGRMACATAQGKRRRVGQPPGRLRWWVDQPIRWWRWRMDKQGGRGWGMDQPSGLWRRGRMGQPLVSSLLYRQPPSLLPIILATIGWPLPTDPLRARSVGAEKWCSFTAGHGYEGP